MLKYTFLVQKPIEEIIYRNYCQINNLEPIELGKCF